MLCADAALSGENDVLDAMVGKREDREKSSNKQDLKIK